MNFRTIGNVWAIRMFCFGCVLCSCSPFITGAMAASKSENKDQHVFSEVVEAANRAEIQQETLLLITQSLFEHTLEEQDAACLLVNLVNAKNDGLPVSLLEEKIVEGKAKGISGSQLCSAIKHMCKEVSELQTLLAHQIDIALQEDVLAVLYEIRAQGVTQHEIRKFFALYADKEMGILLEGIRLHALLNQAGVSSENLETFIALVMQKKSTLMRWKEITQLFSIVVKSGISPNAFMNKAILAVKSGKLPHTLANELSLQPRALGVTE